MINTDAAGEMHCSCGVFPLIRKNYFWRASGLNFITRELIKESWLRGRMKGRFRG